MKPKLDHETLTEILDYDSETGIFVWKISTSRRVHEGEIAGTVDKNGYRRIQIDRRGYLASRLAWFYIYAEWPKYEIDHINLNPGDNSIKNLRDATPSQNSSNRGLRPDNWIGIKGVRRHPQQPNKYMARICVDGKSIFLGSFPTPEEASAAYIMASQLHHGEYGRTA